MDCIFCKIIAGDLPAFRVYEDEGSLAFMDINPLTPGHTLVVPKRHSVNLFDVDEAALEATMRTVRKVALGMKSALGLDSLNLVQANGKWAVQTVLHLHFHLIPRHENDHAGLDWDLRPGDRQVIGSLASRIAAELY